MAGCRQVSFSLCQFLETEVIHQSRAEVCAEKPLAPVPAQTILHRLRPVPKRFPVHGDPSAPGTCLRRTLGLGSREALISQSEPENKRVRVNTLRGRQALSSAKELLGNKIRRAGPCASPRGESTDPHCLPQCGGAPQRSCPSP